MSRHRKSKTGLFSRFVPSPRSSRKTGSLIVVLLLSLVAVPRVIVGRSSPSASSFASSGPISPTPSPVTHRAGRLNLQITNRGVIGDPFGLAPSAGWRGGEYLKSSSLWIGAYVRTGDALDGPYVSTGDPSEFRPRIDPRWAIYESHEGVKGGQRSGFFNGDDDLDGLVDEDFQDGLDNDGDGTIDEDYAAAGDQMFSAEYEDDTPEVADTPDHTPLGLTIQQRSFQWSGDGENEFVGVEFNVINHGTLTLDSLYFGLSCDPDVGLKTVPDFPLDDLVGWNQVDTTIVGHDQGACALENVYFTTAFMWDAPDAESPIQGDDVPGVFGAAIAGSETHSVRWFDASLENGYPTTDAERYALLAAGDRSSGNPRPGVAEASATEPGDYRFVLSAGSFGELPPGGSLRFRVLYAVGAGFGGFHSNMIEGYRVFLGTYVDADKNPNTGIEGKERCLRAPGPGGEVVWDDPCDAGHSTITVQSTDCFWVDDDCNPCTGVDGKEMHLAWLGTTAPPDPVTNLDPDPWTAGGLNSPYLSPPAGDGQVILQWDNISELSPNPFNGKNLFEGYRLWRVDNWQNPEGSSGPLPEDWMLVKEFRRNPLDGLGQLSPNHLRRVARLDRDQIVETTPFGPRYEVGRYEYVDDSVTNGVPYLYEVTAFGVDTRLNPVTGLPETFEVGPGSPYADPENTVTPCDTCDVTAIRLVQFTAERQGGEGVLRWSVTDAQDHAGFEVYRDHPEGRTRINDALLSGRSEYEFRDADAPQLATHYWLVEISRSSVSTWYGPVLMPAATEFPGRLAVQMPYPNPATSGTNLRYALPDSRPVRITVYDLSGRRIQQLVDDVQPAGDHVVAWTGTTGSGGRAAAGLYVILVEAGGESLARKVLLR